MTPKENKNKRMIIFGASGFIGSYLYENMKRYGRKVIGTYNKNKKPGLMHFDIMSSDINDFLIQDVEYAIICSAITKIDDCKRNLRNSYKINVTCLEKIMSELYERNIVPIFISSAAVFDGVLGGYKEEDQRNPINVYGEQKLEGENFILKNFEKYLIVRVGKVFGIREREGLFADWILKYKNKEEIFCADDEILSPTYVEDFARGLNRLIEKKIMGVFHINPENHYSRYKLSVNFFDYLKIKDAKIVKCSLDDFHFLEKRPKNSYLDGFKFMGKTGFRFTSLAECYNMIQKNHF